MYSLEQRRNIENLFKKGKRISDISQQTQISKTTLYRWKIDFDLEKQIEGLIRSENFEEAIQEMSRFSTKYGKEYILLKLRAKIEREKGDTQAEKVLLQRRLELDPNNTKILSSLIRISRKEGDRVEQKRLLERQLKLDPENTITLRGMISIARKEKNKEEEKRLLERQDDVIIKSSLRRIGDIRGFGDNIETTPLDEARRIIYESQDMLADIEKIKETLEGSDETILILVQAEAALKAGLKQRAIKLLKTYRESHKEDRDIKRSMNQALQIAESKKAIYDPVKWEKIYDVYQEGQDNEITEGEER